MPIERFSRQNKTESLVANTNEMGGAPIILSDGNHDVPVEPELGENIRLALRIQDKIDDALMTGSRPGFLRTISMLNCRKAISAVRGKNSIKELVSRKGKKFEEMSEEDKEELHGLPELWKDIDRVIASGRPPVLGSSEDMQIQAYFEEHPQDLPATVHVFDILPRFENELVSKLLSNPEEILSADCQTKMHRDHTFIVLGKSNDGAYVCFHKEGPYVDHRFELKDLAGVIKNGIAPVEDRIYLSFIAPISLDREAAEEGRAAA